MLCSVAVFAQDSTLSTHSRYAFNGYIKELVMVADDPLSDNFLYASQIHNRLRFSWFPNPSLTTRIEVRNRFYSGSLVNKIPGFSEALGQDNGFLDMTYSTKMNQNSALVSQIDRAWIEFRKGKWDITAGRQRINWGLNTVWNPNDVFNAYNVFDFDYEERPGSDAIRLQYTTGDFSFIEGAISRGHYSGDITYAILNRINLAGYDFQIIGGINQQNPFAGIGWAGNIGEAGFKTEATWYFSYRKSDQKEHVIISSGVDYSFKNGWYVNAALLYNNGLSDAAGNSFVVMQQLEEPFPFRYAGFLQMVKEISPIVSAGISCIYGSDNLMVVMPNISWSMASDWDMNVYGQYFTFTDESGSGFFNGFLRIRWSFSD
jgi:hypothetical protein